MVFIMTKQSLKKSFERAERDCGGGGGGGGGGEGRRER